MDDRPSGLTILSALFMSLSCVLIMLLSFDYSFLGCDCFPQYCTNPRLKVEPAFLERANPDQPLDTSTYLLVLRVTVNRHEAILVPLN